MIKKTSEIVKKEKTICDKCLQDEYRVCIVCDFKWCIKDDCSDKRDYIKISDESFKMLIKNHKNGVLYNYFDFWFCSILCFFKYIIMLSNLGKNNYKRHKIQVDDIQENVNNIKIPQSVIDFILKHDTGNYGLTNEDETKVWKEEDKEEDIIW